MCKLTTFTATAALLALPALGQLSQFVQYTPKGDDTLVERSDPIEHPHTLSAHVHQVFGANNFSPDASYNALQKSDCTTVGSASGDGNAADKSSYWHPSLYMEAKDGTGYVRVRTSGHKIYYRDAGSHHDKKASPFEFPEGFRMIAGDARMRAAASQIPRQNITQWICHSSGPWNEGTDGGFPTGVTDCNAYPGFNGAIHFPHCWNGKDFDQSDPSAHVAYPEDNIQDGACPSSHPIRLPHIFMENQFDLHSIADQVKPGSFVLSQGDNTGYGWHVDFFNGWTSGAIPELLSSCPKSAWGNEDIGTCPGFKKFATKTKACKLKRTYHENVDTPGHALPGCNPVTDVNPAPKRPVAALGKAESNCAAAGSSDGKGSGSSGGKDSESSGGKGRESSGGKDSGSSAEEGFIGAAPKHHHQHSGGHSHHHDSKP
ncbi:hypothetical protein MYCFIDRAFT_182252 [Lecanosticta acicola]|uniref:DUF1996 domain-containing protein n=1 Tax=Lecanosticta acicola TaxID=111012 RepID=A0AAI8Z248_9PEZI|nr:hypothetical protein MYCFIDRAFT_182252 [Lecanosticta acicola]